eukprot:1161719-Pelagomonas_calceolata.AAC.8
MPGGAQVVWPESKQESAKKEPSGSYASAFLTSSDGGVFAQGHRLGSPEGWGGGPETCLILAGNIKTQGSAPGQWIVEPIHATN